MNELENQPAPQGTEPVPVVLEPKTSMKKKLGIFAGVVVVLLAVAGVVVYQVYASPSKVWERFVKKAFDTAPTSTKEKILISYQDKGTLSNEILETTPELQLFSNIKVSLDINAYIKTYNEAKSIDMDGDARYTLESGSTSLSANLKLKAKDDVIYVDLGGIPFFATILRQINGGNKVDWVKFDIGEVRKMSEQANGSANMPSQEEQVKKMKEIFEKHNIISVEKVLGREKINGVTTIHFQNKLNKEELKSLLKEIFAYSIDIQPDSEGITGEEKQKAKDALAVFFDTMIDKAEVKTFETWVGMFDAQLYRLKFVSNAPSLVSLIEVAQKAAKLEDSDEDPIKLIEDLINQISFDGEFVLSEEISDYDKEQEVVAPTNSLDILQLIQEQNRQNMEMMQYETMPSNNFQ